MISLATKINGIRNDSDDREAHHAHFSRGNTTSDSLLLSASLHQQTAETLHGHEHCHTSYLAMKDDAIHSRQPLPRSLVVVTVAVEIPFFVLRAKPTPRNHD